MYGMFLGARHIHGSVTARAASIDANEASREVKLLRMDVEKLLMINEALWDILKEQHGYSDEDLIKRVETIDLRDGKLDGKVAKAQKEPTKCPKCNRAPITKHPTCLYCGTNITGGELFDR